MSHPPPAQSAGDALGSFLVALVVSALDADMEREAKERAKRKANHVPLRRRLRLAIATFRNPPTQAA